MLLLLLLALPIILVLFYIKPSKNNHPPGPPGLPFIGNLHQFDGKFPHKYLYNLYNQYGPIMSLKLGSRPVIVISSADIVKEIMKSHDVSFSGRPALVGMKKLSYNNLDIAFSSNNDMWREMRKIFNIHLFSLKQVQYFHPICKDEVSKMIKKIATDASVSGVTNLSELMNSFTSNTICRVAFGKSYEDEEYGKNRFFDLLREAQAVMGGFFLEDYLPLFGWIDKLTGMREMMEKTFRNLDAFYEELFAEHQNPSRPKSMEGDIIDLLLGLKRDETLSSFDLTVDNIKALLMNIIVGGTDASAAILVWALTALIKNPVIMKKAQTEIRELSGKKELVDEEEIAKLPYFRAIVKEIFRLFPPAPLLIPRETIKKCTINGYEIESGSLVYINAWAIARDPKTWKSPNEFLPERFLECDIDVTGRDPEVIPFGVGRRGCPGSMMGMFEVELALANVLHKFDWELPPGMKEEDVDFEVLPGLTTHKKNPICLVAKVVIA